MVAAVVLVVALDEGDHTEMFQAASGRRQLLATTHTVATGVLENGNSITFILFVIHNHASKAVSIDVIRR